MTPHRHRVLPFVYRTILSATRLHGLFTLARLHRRIWKGEQQVAIGRGAELILPDDTHYFGFLSGMHERHIAQLIRTLVKPGGICLDVGANIGYFAAMMAAQCGTNGKVVAFEPIPETYNYLKRNASLAEERSWQIDARQLAVSDTPSDLEVVRQRHSTLNEVRALDPSHTPDGHAETVNGTTLDQVLDELAVPNVQLLKIDVEGHEWPVIKGALSSLEQRKVSNLVIEITPGSAAQHIDDSLKPFSPVTRCWIDGKWKAHPVSAIQHRTDAWLTFDPTPTTQ